jgi:hypothetical protein
MAAASSHRSQHCTVGNVSIQPSSVTEQVTRTVMPLLRQTA